MIGCVPGGEHRPVRRCPLSNQSENPPERGLCTLLDSVTPRLVSRSQSP